LIPKKEKGIDLMGRNKYTRRYLLISTKGLKEQMASSEKEAVEVFKHTYPDAKKVKVIAFYTGNGWYYKMPSMAKDKMYKEVKTEKVYSAFQEGIKGYLDLWLEQKKRDEIHESSSDYLMPIIPSAEELIEIGSSYFEDDEDYIRIK
jgi:hypothetical protein